MDVSAIVSVVEDIENDENTIKLLFKKKLNYFNQDDRLFICIEKYCKISYVMINNEEEVPVWAKSVIQDIELMIGRIQGFRTVKVQEDKSLLHVYKMWKVTGSERKKQEIIKLTSLLNYQKQSILKEEYERLLDDFDIQADNVFD